MWRSYTVRRILPIVRRTHSVEEFRIKSGATINKVQAGGRHDMPPPRPALKRAAAALSQASRARPDQPISVSSRPAAHAAHRPDVRDRRQTDRQTSDVTHADVRQYHRFMPPGRGIITKIRYIKTFCMPWLSLLQAYRCKNWHIFIARPHAHYRPRYSVLPSVCLSLCPSRCGILSYVNECTYRQ